MTSPNGEPLPEFDHTLSLAHAMTERNVIEGIWQHDILANTIPMPPIESLAVVRRIQTGLTTIALGQIENPDLPADPSRVFDALFDDASIAEVLLAQGAEPTEAAVGATRSGLRAQLDFLGMWRGNDPLKLDALRGELEAAATIAGQSGVGIAEVYRQDDLYNALMRSTEGSAQALAMRGLARAADAAKLRPDVPAIERAYAYLAAAELERYWGDTVWTQLDPLTRLRLQIKLGGA